MNGECASWNRICQNNTFADLLNLSMMGQLSKSLINLRSLRHQIFLFGLKEILKNCYESVEVSGKPIENHIGLTEYCKKYHFHKNFYTNYHALWQLFYNYPAIDAPNTFYVYDIACGPYTATITLLKFLENEGNLSQKSFDFTFCEKSDFILKELKGKLDNYYCQLSLLSLLSQQHPQELCQTINWPIAFPIPVDDCSTFTARRWKIRTRSCAGIENCAGISETYGKYQCETEMTHHFFPFPMNQQAPLDMNAINLIFCSYPGKEYDKRFIRCIDRMIKTFSQKQSLLPTYIIFSHHNNKKSEELINDIDKPTNFNLKEKIRNTDPEVPFSNYYYYIFPIEVNNEATIHVNPF